MKSKIKELITRFNNFRAIYSIPKIVLVVCVVVFIVSCIVLTVNANRLLDKVNYIDESTTNAIISKELLEEEEIDFVLPDETETSTTTTTAVTDKNNVTTTKLTTTTTKKAAKSSESLQAIYQVKNGKTEKLELSETEMKKKASEIQKQADKDIAVNTAKKDGIAYSDDVYNFLIVGYDAGGSDADPNPANPFNRADCIVIASLNKKQKTIKIVSLSRATYTMIDGVGNRRINAAFAYGGIDKLIETIEINYKVRIDDYVFANFAGFENIINSMDGISINMTETEASFAFDKTTKAGTYKMNGHEALRYVRLRKTDSDRTRTSRQRKVLKAMFNKFKTMSIAEDIDFLDTVFPYITTNLSKTDIVKLATEAQSYKNYTVTEDIIPHNAVKLSMRDGIEVLILDWNETTSYLQSILFENVSIKYTTPKKVTK